MPPQDPVIRTSGDPTHPCLTALTTSHVTGRRAAVVFLLILLPRPSHSRDRPRAGRARRRRPLDRSPPVRPGGGHVHRCGWPGHPRHRPGGHPGDAFAGVIVSAVFLGALPVAGSTRRATSAAPGVLSSCSPCWPSGPSSTSSSGYCSSPTSSIARPTPTSARSSSQRQLRAESGERAVECGRSLREAWVIARWDAGALEVADAARRPSPAGS